MRIHKDEPHPALCACLLINDSRTIIADELSVSLSTVSRWTRGARIPEDKQRALEYLGVALLASDLEKLGPALVGNPKLISDKAFRDYLNDLNQAHWLLFGRTLIDWLIEVRERRHGNA